MSYTDFTFYQNTYLGTLIVSASFPQLALRASAVLDQISFGRVAVVVTAATDTVTIDLIKKAMCAIAEELQTQDANAGADGITSESIGNYSVSFAANSSKQLTNQSKLSNVAGLWLANTDLLYRGFASDEYGGAME